MKTRLIILAFSVPLFIALAAINGALLYQQEKSALARALDGQALSAAATVAEFIASSDHPENEFTQHVRSKAIKAAASQVKDLDGLYLVGANGLETPLAPAVTPWTLSNYPYPREPVVMPPDASGSAHAYVIALAPAGRGSFVAARLHTGAALARLAQLRWMILFIVSLAGTVGAILAWLVARRIVLNLDANRQAIAVLETGGLSTCSQTFSIRETRELAEAVRLIDASRRASTERLRLETARQDKERTPVISLKRFRRSVLAPASQQLVGADIAIRICGDAPLGCFFAICSTDEKAAVLIGRCDADAPKDALASAIAARHFFEDQFPSDTADDHMKLAAEAFSITALELFVWRREDVSSSGVRLLTVAEPETRRKAERFATFDPAASASETLNDIEALLEPVGVFAAITQAPSPPETQEHQ